MALKEPMEILDLPDGGSVKLHILGFEEGQTNIMPKGGTELKTIDVLRLFVPPADKPHFPHYYDVTSKTLRAQLLPLLPAYIEAQRLLTITKRGIAPAARFSVEVL